MVNMWKPNQEHVLSCEVINPDFFKEVEGGEGVSVQGRLSR